MTVDPQTGDALCEEPPLAFLMADPEIGEQTHYLSQLLVILRGLFRLGMFTARGHDGSDPVMARLSRLPDTLREIAALHLAAFLTTENVADVIGRALALIDADISRVCSKLTAPLLAQ